MLNPSPDSSNVLNQSGTPVERASSFTELIAKSTAENLAERIKPFVDNVKRGEVDTNTAVALAVAGGVATNNYNPLQPLIQEINTVLTAYLNNQQIGSDGWNLIRPAQALFFGIFKGKAGKEVFVKDGLEEQFLKFPDISKNDLPKALETRLDTMKSAAEPERIQALLELGALYYSHNEKSFDIYQNAMAQVLEFVATTPLNARETAAGIISLSHCEAALSREQIIQIAAGGNPSFPEALCGWHIAIADNLPEFINDGGFPSNQPTSLIVDKIYSAKVNPILDKLNEVGGMKEWLESEKLVKAYWAVQMLGFCLVNKLDPEIYEPIQNYCSAEVISNAIEFVESQISEGILYSNYPKKCCLAIFYAAHRSAHPELNGFGKKLVEELGPISVKMIERKVKGLAAEGVEELNGILSAIFGS